MARVDHEVPAIRKALIWITPFFLALIVFAAFTFYQTMWRSFNEIQSLAPIVRIWSNGFVTLAAMQLLLSSLILIVFRALAWRVATRRARVLCLSSMYFAIAIVILSVVFSGPIQNHYMPKLGYSYCDQLERTATRLWFSDWVKNPAWCVRGKDRKWVIEQAAIEEKNKAAAKP